MASSSNSHAADGIKKLGASLRAFQRQHLQQRATLVALRNLSHVLDVRVVCDAMQNPNPQLSKLVLQEQLVEVFLRVASWLLASLEKLHASGRDDFLCRTELKLALGAANSAASCCMLTAHLEPLPQGFLDFCTSEESGKRLRSSTSCLYWLIRLCEALGEQAMQLQPVRCLLVVLRHMRHVFSRRPCNLIFIVVCMHGVIIGRGFMTQLYRHSFSSRRRALHL